ncbi:O-antigen polymerase [Vibrio splendidus]
MIFKLLIGLFAFSVFGGVLIDQPLGFYDITDNINAFFVCLCLFLLFIPFNGTYINRGIVNNTNPLNKKIIQVVIFLGFLSLFVNVYILSKSYSYLMSSSLSIGDYKNLGYGKDMIMNSINPALRMFSNLFSPLSYICLALHFYYIINFDRYKSVFSLFGALNIAIVPLFYFARGGIFTFCILYLAMFLLIFRCLSKESRKQIFKFLLYWVTPVFFVFVIITLDRFESYPYFRSGTLVSNHAVFAVLDYFSQWLVNGNYLLDNFSQDKILYGSNFTYLPSKLLGIFDISFANLQELRESVLLGYENNFNGSITLLVYDFGYFGALIFCLWYALFAYYMLRFNSGRSLSFLIKVSLFLPIPIFFFQGLFTVFGFYNIAIVYGAAFIFSQRLRLG